MAWRPLTSQRRRLPCRHRDAPESVVHRATARHLWPPRGRRVGKRRERGYRRCRRRRLPCTANTAVTAAGALSAAASGAASGEWRGNWRSVAPDNCRSSAQTRSILIAATDLRRKSGSFNRSAVGVRPSPVMEILRGYVLWRARREHRQHGVQEGELPGLTSSRLSSIARIIKAPREIFALYQTQMGRACNM